MKTKSFAASVDFNFPQFNLIPPSIMLPSHCFARRAALSGSRLGSKSKTKPALAIINVLHDAGVGVQCSVTIVLLLDSADQFQFTGNYHNFSGASRTMKFQASAFICAPFSGARGNP
jgi:hypothetical protein